MNFTFELIHVLYFHEYFVQHFQLTFQLFHLNLNLIKIEHSKLKISN
jgi:hypothetical protein